MKRLILVSDSSEELVATLSKIGAELDLQVVSDPPARVVSRARKEHPQLIVLDVGQKDGLELLSLLKTGMNTRTIPVIVVSSDESNRDMALEIGADAFVAKPLGPDFLPKVATFLDGQK